MDIGELYREFDPLRPLRADENDLYIDWQNRLDADDVKPRLAHSVSRAGSPVVRLFTGHRGSGKTTELYRVAQRLSQGNGVKRFFVSMLFAEQWLDLEDVQPEDVVFQIVRQLVGDLKAAGFRLAETSFGNWWGRFRDRFRDEVNLEGFEVGADPLKVSLAIEAFPTARREFRRLLQGQLPTIYGLVNDELFGRARDWLAKPEHGGYDDLVIIVDQLDRIPQKVLTEQGLTNHENLFLDHAGPLKALQCSALYTIPIELAYSRCRARLEDEYGNEIFMLPTIPVSTRGGEDDPRGLGVLRDIVERRSRRAGISADDLFESPSLLDDVLSCSGGHLRGLLVLLSSLLDRVDELPIRHSVVQRAIRRAASDLALPLREEDWACLREVHRTKEPAGTEGWCNTALKNRFVFMYEDERGRWYDRNPLLSYADPGGDR